MRTITLTRPAGGHAKGDTITVTDGAAEHLVEVAGFAEYTDDTTEASASDDADTTDYASLKVDELNDLIDTRNETRDEDDWIIPDGAKKADLVAALEADDTTQASE